MKTFLVRAGGYGGGIGDVVYTENGSSGEREYFLYNVIGSTSALTDDSGSVISTTNYGAWGAETGTTGSSENVRKFSTKERSASIGLDYFGFRYYDYDLGRFTTRDPSGYPDGPNNYLYCDNNPVNKIDALGLYSWWDDVIGTATEFSKMAWLGTKEVASIIGEGSAAVVTGKSSVKDLAAGIGKNVVDKIDGVIEKNANRISAQVEGGSSWAGATVATAGAMVGDVMGYTPLLEGAHGTDLASGQQLSEVDRASRMLTGGGQLILSGIAVGKTYDPNASFSGSLWQIAEKQAPQPSAGEKVLTQIEKNVKPENTSGFRGGAYRDMRYPVGDGKDAHHMPADAINGIPREKGSAIQMTPVDHKKTLSYGNDKTSTLFREKQKQLIESGNMRGAMAREIWDVRRIAREGGDVKKYNKAMQEMLEYAKKEKMLNKKNKE